MYLSSVNREFLRSLMGERSALVDRITPHHMGEFFVFSCNNKQDADEISGIIKKDREHLEAMIGNYPIKVVIREKRVATKYKIVYTIPSRKEEKINMATTTATTEYTLENFTDPLKEQLIDVTDEEIYKTPLSVNTLSAIAGDVVANRMRNINVATSPAPVAPKEEVKVEAEVSKTPAQILKDLGLPYLLGKVKKLVAGGNAKVPAKLTEKTKATELKGIKAFLQEALTALTTKEDKQIYVLKAIAEGSEAGNIYLDSLIPCFKELDTKPEHKESRRAKLIEAAKSLLGEEVAEAA